MDTNDQLSERYPGVSFGLNVQILRLAETTIAPETVVGDNVWLNICRRDGAKRLEVGRCVLIGRQGVVSALTHVEIGGYVLMGLRVFIADNDHSFVNILKTVYAAGREL